MTNTRDDQSLSKLELLVLARLACSKGANEDQLAAAVTEVAAPDGPRSARELAVEALAALRGRALAVTPRPTKRSPRPRSKMTASGEQALRAVFGAGIEPSWKTLKKQLAPMFARHCDPPSLSNLELLVLARVSNSKGANDEEARDALVEIAPPDGPRSPHDHAAEALKRLQKYLLITNPKATKRSPNPRSKLRDEGARVLRTAFGCDTTPSWATVRDRSIPARALGIPDNSETASGLGNADSLVLIALRRHFLLPAAPTISALCDTMIAKELELSGELTLQRIRAHFLARALGLDPTLGGAVSPEDLAARAAIRAVEPASEGNRSLRQVLGRRWAYRVVSVATVEPPATPKLSLLRPPGPPDSRPPVVVSADRLLDLVREAIPRIGSDGRFGPEKIFVSALWRYIEDDGRMPDWSLERFKGWLVTANRDQLIDLARADLQGDMDDRLVEQSEIRDQGATFHFVVDRRAAMTGRGFHAR